MEKTFGKWIQQHARPKIMLLY